MNGMKKINQLENGKKCGILIVALLLAVVFVEYICNYQLLKYRNDVQNLEIVQTTDKKKQIIQCEFLEPQYIGKLRISGVFADEQTYRLQYNYVNGFDSQEMISISDKAYPDYPEAWSPVNQKLTSFTITFSDCETVEIAQVQSVTRPEINVCRCLFTALIVILGGSIVLFGTELLKYLHYYFVIYALGFGLLMNFGAGAKYTTWDEPVHFASMYMLSYGEMVEWNTAARMICDSGMPDANTKEELAMMKVHLNQQAGLNIESVQNQSSFLNRSQWIYFPMVMFYRLGRTVGLTFSNCYLFGRLGNLLSYIVIGAWAIRITRRRKILTAAVLMFPTAVFQASMYTYDGIIVAMLTLASVLLMNELGKEKEPYDKKAIAAMTCLVFAVSLIKPVYLPLLLLLLALKKKNTKKTVVFAVMLVAIVIFILSLFFMPSVIEAFHGNLMHGADSRGGETGIAAQLLSMITHPFESVRLMLHEMLTMDNFRNLALKGMDDYMPTNLMLLNLGNLGCIKDEWSLVLIPLLLLLFLVVPEKWDMQGRHGIRKIFGWSLLLCVMAVWGAMYLCFTPVGASSIGGVQARYFIPIMVPIGYFFWNNRIAIQMKELNYNRIILGGILLLMGECVWQLVIVNRCV